MRCMLIYTATFGTENDYIFHRVYLCVSYNCHTKPLFSHAKLTGRSLRSCDGLCVCVYSVRCNLCEPQSSKFFLRLPPVIIKLLPTSLSLLFHPAPPPPLFLSYGKTQ